MIDRSVSIINARTARLFAKGSEFISNARGQGTGEKSVVEHLNGGRHKIMYITFFLVPALPLLDPSRNAGTNLFLVLVPAFLSGGRRVVVVRSEPSNARTNVVPDEVVWYDWERGHTVRLSDFLNR
jgi:hypothetical protein